MGPWKKTRPCMPVSAQGQTVQPWTYLGACAQMGRVDRSRLAPSPNHGRMQQCLKKQVINHGPATRAHEDLVCTSDSDKEPKTTEEEHKARQRALRSRSCVHTGNVRMRENARTNVIGGTPEIKAHRNRCNNTESTQTFPGNKWNYMMKGRHTLQMANRWKGTIWLSNAANRSKPPADTMITTPQARNLT